MANKFISDLIGTMSTFFRINSIRLKNNSNVLEVKNVADDGFYPVKSSSLQLPGATSGMVTLSAPAIAGTQDYEFPANDGNASEVLTTDGAGVLTWTPVALATNMVLSQTEIIAHGDTSPTVLFTPPPNAHLLKVVVDVETAFDGTSPSMSVGIAGTVSKYMSTTDIDLATIAVYEVSPMFEEDGTPNEVIVSFVPGAGHAAGSARVTMEYANPG